MKLVIFIFIVSFGILTRVTPHIPNFSPEIVFALYLGMKYSKAFAFLAIVFMAIISDVLLGWGFGHWVLFTYSALLLIGWIGLRLKNRNDDTSFIMTSCFVTIGYWVWTNFGVWLMENMYSPTIAGMITCYEMALPFLQNSLAASLVWSIIIVLSESYLPASKSKLPFSLLYLKH